MFKNKREINFKDRKYLIFILILMLIAAFGLTIANFFHNNRGVKNEPAVKETALEVKDTVAKSQSYLATAKPELNENDQVLGNKAAALKIFIYEDYDDVYSAQLAETLKQLVSEKGDELTLIFRSYVGASPKSASAALALDCAAASGKWEAMRNALFNGLKKAPADVEAGQEIFYYASSLGLNKDEFAACLTNAQKSGRIEQLQLAAAQYKVQGSPVMFIGDEIILGARPYEDYQDSNGDQIEGLKSVVERVLAGK
jgi:protein-disulfide isomerase